MTVLQTQCNCTACRSASSTAKFSRFKRQLAEYRLASSLAPGACLYIMALSPFRKSTEENDAMSKARDQKKTEKKEPTKTLKEKRAAKKEKKKA